MKTSSKLKKIDNICEIKKENHIIVIPEGVNMRDAISLYTTNANLYVEYLHWNNSGVLDGFIDHNKNMYFNLQFNPTLRRRFRFVYHEITILKSVYNTNTASTTR